MKTTEIFQLTDDALLKKIYKKYAQTGLSFGWKSNNEKYNDYGHWNNLIINGSIYATCDMSKTPHIEKHKEIRVLWEKIKILTGNKTLIRCYVNGYTFGTDAYAHKDDSWYIKKYGDVNSKTIIIYLNDKWHIDWAGETVLFEDNEIEKSVLPKFGRMLIFDSQKLHAARPLSRTCPVLRSVLVFKTGDVNVTNNLIDFLLPLTKNIKHNNKSFFEHLLDTSIILENLGQSEQVCKAALFHAIYSTEFFKHDLNVSRDTITDLIGEYSENLVYEFCNLQHRYESLITNSKNYNNDILKDLLLIEAANLKDQNFNGQYDQHIRKITEKLDIQF